MWRVSVTGGFGVPRGTLRLLLCILLPRDPQGLADQGSKWGQGPWCPLASRAAGSALKGTPRTREAHAVAVPPSARADEHLAEKRDPRPVMEPTLCLVGGAPPVRRTPVSVGYT